MSGRTLTGMIRMQEGTALQARGEHAQAAAMFTEAVAIFREADDRKHLATALSNLAQAHFHRQDLTSAMTCVTESATIRSDPPDARGLSVDYQLMGSILLRVGATKEALDLFRDAHHNAMAAGDESIEASALANVGLVAFELKMYDMAEQCFRNSQELRTKLGDRLGVARNLNHLGRIQEIRNDRSGAAALYRESLSILRILGAPDAAIAADNLKRVSGSITNKADILFR